MDDEYNDNNDEDKTFVDIYFFMFTIRTLQIHLIIEFLDNIY